MQLDKKYQDMAHLMYLQTIKLKVFSYVDKLNRMFVRNNFTFSFIKLLEDFMVTEVHSYYLDGFGVTNEFVFYKSPDAREYSFLKGEREIVYVTKDLGDGVKRLFKIV